MEKLAAKKEQQLDALAPFVTAKDEATAELKKIQLWKAYLQWSIDNPLGGGLGTGTPSYRYYRKGSGRMNLPSQPPLSNPAFLVGLLVLAILLARTIEVNVGPLKITFRKPRRRKRR